MEYIEMLEQLRNNGPDTWQQLPKIKLIISQLIEMIDEQHPGSSFFNEEKYKSSMVNHFAKKGIVPRAQGKKYGKEHIAINTACAMFKQVLTLENMIPLIKNCAGDGKEVLDHKIKAFYEEFLEISTREKEEILCKLDSPGVKNEKDVQAIANTAMECAIKSYMNQLACKMLIEQLSEISGDGKGK
ncbi:MAG: DUF1836 domain-containing protein [Peptostreptococcaceae bacterium]|nr:DUF1836 domain-containing protein [Peptostreptococcaceae bacterium]MDY5739335.1 DUF1836 domain-containing protein [Anaerovoracaceae bacterium]